MGLSCPLETGPVATSGFAKSAQRVGQFVASPKGELLPHVRDGLLDVFASNAGSDARRDLRIQRVGHHSIRLERRWVQLVPLK
jgi:hypothetical protein